MRVLPDSFYNCGGSLKSHRKAQLRARAATTNLSDGHTQGTSSSSGSNRGRPTLRSTGAGLRLGKTRPAPLDNPVFNLPVRDKGAPKWKSSSSQ